MNTPLPAQSIHELAEQLVATRKSLGMSQADLADKLGTTQSAVARLESLRDGSYVYVPRADVLWKWCLALGFSGMILTRKEN